MPLIDYNESPLIQTEKVEKKSLRKIISGGQTGADQAGLFAARDLEFETGGWLPQGCKTLRGPTPELMFVFGMREDINSNYAVRTAHNVRDSDATVRFASNFKSTGEICTLNAINKFRKPYLDIPLSTPRDRDAFILLNAEKIVEFICSNNIEILNIAGNADRGNSNFHFVHTYDILYKALSIIRKTETQCTSRSQKQET